MVGLLSWLWIWDRSRRKQMDGMHLTTQSSRAWIRYEATEFREALGSGRARTHRTMVRVHSLPNSNPKPRAGKHRGRLALAVSENNDTPSALSIPHSPTIGGEAIRVSPAHRSICNNLPCFAIPSAIARTAKVQASATASLPPSRRIALASHFSALRALRVLRGHHPRLSVCICGSHCSVRHSSCITSCHAQNRTTHRYCTAQ